MAIFFLKRKIFGNFILKKCQVFGNFLTVKWQFSGGSDADMISNEEITGINLPLSLDRKHKLSRQLSSDKIIKHSGQKTKVSRHEK